MSDTNFFYLKMAHIEFFVFGNNSSSKVSIILLRTVKDPNNPSGVTTLKLSALE